MIEQIKKTDEEIITLEIFAMHKKAKIYHIIETY